MDNVMLRDGAEVPSPIVLRTLDSLVSLLKLRPEAVLTIWHLSLGLNVPPDDPYVYKLLAHHELIDVSRNIVAGPDKVIRTAISIETLPDGKTQVVIKNPLPFPLQELQEWRAGRYPKLESIQ